MQLVAGIEILSEKSSIWPWSFSSPVTFFQIKKMRVLGLWTVSKQAQQQAFKPKFSIIFKHGQHTKAFITTPIYYVNAGNISNLPVNSVTL
jgi:hypothetical protein